MEASASGYPCSTAVSAQVVALDQVLHANRMGATVPGGMIYALASDVQPIVTDQCAPDDPDSVKADDWSTWVPGCVELKYYKRPRPMVLRVNRGQCLDITFRNLLTPVNNAADCDALQDKASTCTRAAGVFAQGMEWVNGPQDDASWVGVNATSLATPGQTKSYQLFAPEQGPFLLYSTGDDYTGNGLPNSPSFADGGQLTVGLFGAVMVQPEYAEYYRSQVNHEDLCLASTDNTIATQPDGTYVGGSCKRDLSTLPKIDYQAVYPAGHERAGMPILNMLKKGKLVHSDLTAIITGPKAGRFPESMGTLPVFHDLGKAKTYPDRLEPYREFSIIYHELLTSQQAFVALYDNSQLQNLMQSAGDNFAINYGMGGIGSEILANRFEVGPMGNCTDCKYEEFFLSSWPNGDPAMIVNRPADNGCQESTGGDFTTFGCPDHQPATRSYYPDDPSNVYHSYLWDHTKFRILHGGVDLHHLHHLHAHQWLGSPNTSKGHYLDSQAIGPGSAFTLETVYNGGGNKNLTVGDSIFHCHFYPHFAAGMWALWRVHDVFEAGTELEGYPYGNPKVGSRAQPDGEIAVGTPIPAVVPMPTKAMAPVPAAVQLTADGKKIEVCQGTQGAAVPGSCISNLEASGSGDYMNPGFPFFIPGVAGSRAPHPPMDFARACSVSGEPCEVLGAACGGGGGVCETLDGGLPRHVVEPDGVTHAAALNPLDFSKDVLKATAFGLPEEGTFIEQVAMKFHAQRTHATQEPKTGNPAEFIANGQEPRPGAPYADPCIDIYGQVPEYLTERNYWAVDIQTEATYNKEGWHYPQQRMISLWGDAFDFMGISPGKARKPPEPFFFRANSWDCVQYRLASLIPKTYELDDFQVRTPTDVLGQHIHLVKFDVTSSDGAANGWNYEDGTLGPDEVIERINAFNNGTFHTTYQGPVAKLDPDYIKFFGADPGCAEWGEGYEKCRCERVEYEENGKKYFSVKGGRWCGSQATFQLWYVDPQLIDTGQDRTMRTVFTHDHFGPSTHQQTGLYAGLVAEPYGSVWRNNQDGSVLGNRAVTQNGVTVKDGGPTSWQAVIETQDKAASFREFLIEFQDTSLMYRPFPYLEVPGCPVDTVSQGGKEYCPISYGFCSTDHSIACTTNSDSSLFYEKVCPKSIDLPQPNPAGGDPLTPSKLEASCNYIAGIPSSNSLFDDTSNVWGLSAGAELDELKKIGWNTLPIDPGSSGLAPVGGPAQPELISFNGSTANFTLNYRNEPLYNRIHSTSADPNANNLSYVYASLDRDLPNCGTSPIQGCGWPPDPLYTTPLTPGVQPGDPFTPLLRAYQGDDVQIRVLVGAHQNPHNFTVHGIKWLFEPSNVNSGWRSTQTMGISEHFEFLFKLPTHVHQPDMKPGKYEWSDYLYKPTVARKGAASGNWGLMRAYEHLESTLEDGEQTLYPLPQNPEPGGGAMVCPGKLASAECTELQPDGFWASPPDANGHRLRCYSVVAASVADLGFPLACSLSRAACAAKGDVCPGGGGICTSELIYNTKLDWGTPDATIYLHLQDYEKLAASPQKPVPGFDPAQGLAEPVVLRAAAGDCLRVKVINKIESPPCSIADPNKPSCYLSGQLPVAGQNDANRNMQAGSDYSTDVGLHPQLVSYHVALSDGTNAGFNQVQTVAPGKSRYSYWYAGNIDPKAPEGQQHIPIEFGAANLMPSDPMNQHQWGLFGALIIEPEGSTWTTDSNSRTSATVKKADGSSFREFVLVFQDDVFVRNAKRRAGPGAFGALNLRTEELRASGGTGFRLCSTDQNAPVDCVLSDDALCQGSSDPNANPPVACGADFETPLFCAQRGAEARFRLLHPGGAVTNQVFELHGHAFAEEPYMTRQANCQAPITHANLSASQVIDVGNECPDGNVQLGPSLTEWKAARMGHGPSNHYDVVVSQSGGHYKRAGDYLYRTYPAAHFRTGIWGLFRVTDGPPTAEQCPSLATP